MQAHGVRVKTTCRKRNRSIGQVRSSGTNGRERMGHAYCSHVKKKRGCARCGDFKITLNDYITINKSPLHTIDEIFAVLQGGDEFTELDMTHQYMQFPMEESCSHLLTIITHKGLFRYTKIPEGVQLLQQKYSEKWMNAYAVLTVQ